MAINASNNDRKEVVDLPGPTESTNPDLEFLLMDLTTEHKKLVIEAFYGFARGDPKGFNSRFAVLLQAHAHALRTYPYRIKKFLDAKTNNMVDQTTTITRLQREWQQEAAILLDTVKQIAHQIHEDATRIEKTIETRESTPPQPSESTQPSTEEIVKALALHFVLPYAVIAFFAGMLVDMLFRFFHQ